MRALFEHANQALTLIGRQLARRPASLETSQSRLGQLLLHVSSDYPRLLPIGTQVAQAEVRSTRDICIGHDYYSG